MVKLLVAWDLVRQPARKLDVSQTSNYYRKERIVAHRRGTEFTQWVQTRWPNLHPLGWGRREPAKMWRGEVVQGASRRRQLVVPHQDGLASRVNQVENPVSPLAFFHDAVHHRVFAFREDPDLAAGPHHTPPVAGSRFRTLPVLGFFSSLQPTDEFPGVFGFSSTANHLSRRCCFLSVRISSARPSITTTVPLAGRFSRMI